MDALVVVLALCALAGLWIWIQYRLSGSRMWTPLWTAFSLTAGALLFLAAGATGYELQGGIPFSRASSWTGSAVWWEIGAGIVLAVIAAPLWWLGLRRINAG